MTKIIGFLLAAILTLATPLGLGMIVTVVATPAMAEEHRTISCEGAQPATGDWRPPFETAYVVTSRFDPARVHPVYGLIMPHNGIDLVSQPGPGKVVAASAGTVTAAGFHERAGNYVDVQHAGGVSTRYLHLAVPALVGVGTQVHTGQQLGIEGSTGASTGPHLHFEVHLDGVPVDPEPFMAERGTPLSGAAVAPSPPPGTPGPDLPGEGEGGIGFDLPEPGEPRKASLTNPAQPIPAEIEDLYHAAADRYNLPWTLLAGIGMAETNHGALTGESSAGALGLMQFMPATFADYGVDGDGDGIADINNDADSIYSAANYLVASGVTNGPEGVREALFAYNHAAWYVNDVLYYAHGYGGGLVLADPQDCGPGTGGGNPDLPPVDSDRVATMLEFAAAQDGDAYVLGANGPDVWDCSSLTQQAMAAIGITSPRTAQSQRDWLALGNGIQVSPDQARPGDLIFYSSYLGPETIGHVAFVWDPATMTTIEAANPTDGVGFFSYEDDLDRDIFEIWRLGSISDEAATAAP